MRKSLLHTKRIRIKRLRSQKGASVVFALVGFMFAAMISFVVINAAYSAATRTKKLKYDEQAFLLAQSMSGIITEALTGSGEVITLPDDSKVHAPEKPDVDLKYDALTIGYEYIDQKDPADGSVVMYYNSKTAKNSFVINAGTGESKSTFYKVEGKTSLSSAATAVQNMVVAMAKKIDQGNASSAEKLTTSYNNDAVGEVYKVETEFTMDKSYSIEAITTATVTKGGTEKSKYIVRMNASAAARTDKIVCVGTRPSANTISIADFKKHAVTAEGEEFVKVSCYSVTWPVDQMRSVYAQ